jgi:maleate isomerase
MFGWRARIALVLPADNTVIEPELYALGVEGVSFHGLRLTSDDPVRMREQAGELAESIEEMAADVVVYACAETSFNGGSSTPELLSEHMAARCSVPVVTATGAMVDAVQRLGLRTVTVISPYSQDSGALLESSLAERGIGTAASHHRDFSETSTDPRTWYDTNRQESWVSYRMAREADVPGSEGVLVSGTNFRTLATVQLLEDELGKPVVTSNQAILWRCLDLLGSSTPLAGYGRLLRDTTPAPAS